MENPYFKAFVKDNFLVLLGQVLIFLKPLLIAPLVIKTVSVEAFGGYVLVLSLAGFVIGTAPLGVGFLFKRYAPSEKDLSARAGLFYRQFVFQLLSVMLCCSVLLAFSAVIERAFFSGIPSFSMPLLAVYGVLYTVYGQIANYFRYTSRMREFVHATVAFPYLGIFFVLAAYFSGYQLSINSLVFMDICALAVVSLAVGWKIISEIGYKVCLPGFAEIKRDISLGFPSVLSYWTDFVLTASSRYFIAFFISLAAVGAYSAALQVGLLASVFPRILGVAMPPLIAKAVDAGDVKSAATLVDYAIKGFLTLSVPFAVMSAFFSKPVISLYADKAVGNLAYYIVPLAAIATVFYGLANIFSYVLSVILKTKKIFYANLIASALNLAVNIVGLYFAKSLLVPALSLIAGYFAVFLLLYRELPNEWGISVNFSYALKSGLWACLSGIAGYALLEAMQRAGLSLGAAISPALIATLSIHTFFILKFRVISEKEMAYVQGCMRRAVSKFSPAV